MKILQGITEIFLPCSELSWLLILGEEGESINFPVTNKFLLSFISFVIAKSSLASYICCKLFFALGLVFLKEKHIQH